MRHLPVKTDRSCEGLFYKCGGCNRPWLGRNFLDTSLAAKVMHMVLKNGYHLLERTATSKGSVVHFQVEFDELKPIRKLSAYPKNRAASLGAFNDFGDSSTEYVFRSQYILEIVDETLVGAEEESLKPCIGDVDIATRFREHIWWFI
eukprot:scaffold2923_cov121-Cylindrotheca_fusiformis.AAC.4